MLFVCTIDQKRTLPSGRDRQLQTGQVEYFAAAVAGAG
jgi:hypothetical protein